VSVVEVIGNCTLILGDSKSLIHDLEFDCFFTDPPYGVNGGSGTLGKASKKTKYEASWDDTEDYISNCISKIIASANDFCARGAVTPGTKCMWLYPRPDDVGAIYQPAATGLNKWGRETTQPVLFYGKDPRAGKTIKPKHFQQTSPAEKCGHPCPKPLKMMEWLVDRVSLEGEVVFDPFMGSGTTGVACVNTGRGFVGVEIEPRYFEVACERVSAAYSQGRLF